MKAIGPTFYYELKAQKLVGLPFSWGADGVIVYGAAITSAQQTAIQAVYEAHDPTKLDLTASAQEALDKSDVTLLRCLENGIAIPAAWVSYRASLRTITAATNFPTALPAQPAYPAGS